MTSAFSRTRKGSSIRLLGRFAGHGTNIVVTSSSGCSVVVICSGRRGAGAVLNLSLFVSGEIVRRFGVLLRTAKSV